MTTEHCLKCKYAYPVYASGIKFLGCAHKPYHRKWVVEIKKCPKENDHPTEKGGAE